MLAGTGIGAVMLLIGLAASAAISIVQGSKN